MSCLFYSGRIFAITFFSLVLGEVWEKSVRALFLLLMAIVPSVTHAAFQEIWSGYQKSSRQQLRQLDMELVRNQLNLGLSQNAWALNLSGNFEDSYLDSLFSFQAQRTISDSFVLQLSRPTFRYGTFSLEHTQSRVDISNWETSFFATSAQNILYEVRTGLNYSYQVLGRAMPLKEEIAAAQFSQGEAQNSLEQEQEYLEFFRAYLGAKLQFFLSQLNLEFEKRALERVDIATRRFKDGLSRQVEVLQAKSSLAARKREVQSSKANLKQNLATIESVLGFVIPEEVLKSVEWNFHAKSFWLEKLEKKKNKQLLSIQANIELAFKELERFEDERSHRLTLNAGYIANAYTEGLDQSYTEAWNRPRNDTKQISLVYSVPLGGDFSRSEKQKLVLEKKRNRLQKKQLEDDLRVKEDVLVTQLGYFEQSYEQAKQQVSLALKTIDEQNKLYLRGLVSIDDVIRSEEELLQSRSALYQAHYEQEMALSELSFVYGSVKNLLNIYAD